jgi:uncharacterized membrane protein YhaH (DUF805 family)
MLGYKGRTGRRDFIAGGALLTVGSQAIAMAIKPSIPWLFAALERNVALAVALALTLFVCGVVILWFWGWTVLATRRARDMGLPAWAGVLSLVMLVGIGRMTAGLPAPFAMIAGWGVILIWLAVMAFPASVSREPRERTDPALNAA